MRQPETTVAVHSLPWRAVLLSLVLHGLLVAAIALAPPLQRTAEAPTPTIRLVAVATGEPETAPEPVPAEPETADPTPPPGPAAPSEVPAPTDAPDLPEASGTNAPSPSEPTTNRPQPDESTAPRDEVRSGISARILEQIGAREPKPATDGGSDLPWAGTGSAIPGLPGARGWLSGHVGRVDPQAHRWQANDGSSRGRYVLADGTVVCTQRRAPTIDEIMNPWKSLAVTQVSVCGRERPAPPDFSDPRTRPPPRPRSAAPTGG